MLFHLSKLINQVTYAKAAHVLQHLKWKVLPSEEQGVIKIRAALKWHGVTSVVPWPFSHMFVE